MNESLGVLEQRLRATPDDVATLRAIAQARLRIGDACGAWRVRARLARLIGTAADWGAPAPTRGEPCEPGAMLKLRGPDARARIVSLADDGVVLRSSRVRA